MMRFRLLLRLVDIQRVLVRHNLDDFITSAHLFRPLRFLFYLSPFVWIARNPKEPRGVSIRKALEELGPDLREIWPVCLHPARSAAPGHRDGTGETSGSGATIFRRRGAGSN